MTRNIENMK